MKSRSDIPKNEIDEIINKCEVCVIGMIDGDNGPYILPFNFGYKDGRLFIHSGPEGKKIGIWEKDNRVCVSFSTDFKLNVRHENVACSYSMRYRSLLIYGKVIPLIELDEKAKALNIIMEKYSGRADFSYNKPALINVKVFEIIISNIESRAYGY
jgi:hypothetical protein